MRCINYASYIHTYLYLLTYRRRYDKTWYDKKAFHRVMLVVRSTVWLRQCCLLSHCPSVCPSVTVNWSTTVIHESNCIDNPRVFAPLDQKIGNFSKRNIAKFSVTIAVILLYLYPYLVLVVCNTQAFPLAKCGHVQSITITRYRSCVLRTWKRSITTEGQLPPFLFYIGVVGYLVVFLSCFNTTRVMLASWIAWGDDETDEMQLQMTCSRAEAETDDDPSTSATHSRRCPCWYAPATNDDVDRLLMTLSLLRAGRPVTVTLRLNVNWPIAHIIIVIIIISIIIC